VSRTSVADRDWFSTGRAAAGSVTIRDCYTTFDPSTESPLAEVADFDDAGVDAVVRQSAEDQVKWAKLPPRVRARHVREFATALRANADELASLDALDAGLPRTAMLNDVEFAAEYLEIMCDLALDLGGRTIPASQGNLHYTINAPYGVVARIVPYNHPLFFAASKLGPPLVAGNSVILKAPDQAPLSALRIGEIAAETLPCRVVSIISGSVPASRALVRHPLIRRIAFIGSDAVGRSIQRDAADAGVKNVSLELGGKNAMLVFDDADPVRAATGAVLGMNFGVTAGQSCGSTSRLLVHESIAEEVVENVLKKIAEIRIGDPMDPAFTMGPLITRKQFDHVSSVVKAGCVDGAELITGGGHPDGENGTGFYFAPTVLTGVSPTNRAAQTEAFGPVLSVLTFKDEDEAVRIANGVEFGLTAAVWTDRLDRAHRVAEQMDAGYVWINGTGRHFWGVPFGGWKDSGVGREEDASELLSFTQTKAVNVVMS